MKRIFTALILLVSIYTQSNAQLLSGTQCESNPCNALPICGTSLISQTFAFPSVLNPGSPIPFSSCTNNAGVPTTVNNNWVFYQFTCYTAGDLNFLITPNQPNTNLNWVLWDITSTGCGSLNNVVECNTDPSTAGSSTVGSPPTGCAPTPTLTLIEPTVSLAPGTYILGVQRPTGGTITTGFTIDFTGTTADLTDNVQPTLATVLPITTCGPVNTIKVVTSKKVRCSQIAAADFSVTGATVSAATGSCALSCTNAAPNNVNVNYSQLTDTISVTFASALSAGNHTISVTANNVFSDICGNGIQAPSSITFFVPAVLNDSIRTGFDCATQTYTDTVYGTGGSSPYQYKIFTSGSPAPANNGIYSAATSSYVVFTGLYGGIAYKFTTKDAFGCLDSTTITHATFTPLGAPNLSSVASPSCNNQFSTDSLLATVNIATGFGPYSWTLASSPAGVASTGTSTPIIGNFRKWSGLSGFTTNVTYTVTVTDLYGCTKTAVTSMVNPAVLTLPNPTSTNPLCFGDSSGCITNSNSFAALGGNGLYSYSISPSFSNTTQSGPSGNIFCNLPGSPSPGIIYTITVMDSKGCTATNTKAITSNAAIVIKNTNTTLPITFVNPTCTNACGGSIKPITVTGFGGVGSKKYYLYPIVNISPLTFTDSSNNVTTPVLGQFSNLCIGTYTVMAKDAAGCTATATYSLALPPIPDLVQDSITNVSCFGTCGGKIYTTTTGGASPFTYAITPATNSPCGVATQITANSGDFQNLPAGFYKIVVTSTASAALGGGCKDSVENIQVTEPPVLVIDSAKVDSVTCFGLSTGKIKMYVSGGTAPYQYSKNNCVTYQAADSFINLAIGTFTICVKDAKGCTKTSVITVSQPLVLNANTSKTNVTCFGLCNGTGKVVSIGGTKPYSYTVTGPGTPTYNPSGTGNDSLLLSTLCSGNYVITVTDLKGCTVSKTITITQPTAITSTKTQVNVSCFGQCTGTATVTPSGGKGGTYNYTITSSPLGSSPTINASGTIANLANLCSGTYIIQTTDSNTCIKLDTILITQPSAALTATAVQGLQITCNNLCNATGTVTPNGGTPNYSYSIVNATGNINATGALGNLTNLCVGTYTINVTDSKSCATSVTIVIAQPTPLVINSSSADSVTCFGLSTGAVHMNVTGGTGVITYSILPAVAASNTTGNFTGLAKGCYTVTAKDINLCSISDTICVEQPLLLTATSLKLSDATCNGLCNGTGKVTPSNGNGNYIYAVTTPASATSLPIFNTSGNVCNLSGLCAGTYTINVTDSKGCTASTTLVIGQPNPVVPSYLTTQTPTCTPGCDGQAQVSAIGGNAVYTYVSILPATATINATTGLATGLCAGTNYTVLVNDGNSCSGNVIINLSTPAGPSAVNISSQNNPSCSPGCDGSATVSAVGGTGIKTYTIQIPLGSTCTPTQPTSGTFNNLGTGTYTVIASDVNNCTISNTFILVNQPSTQIATLDTIDASCNPGCDGKVIMTAQAGMSYTVTGFGTPIPAGDTIKNLCANNIYTVIGTNSTGCKDTIQVQVGTAGSTPIDTVSTTVSGCSPCSGIITMQNIVGMVYNLQGQSANTNVPNRVFVGLCAGSYTIEGKDINGCVSSKVVTIGVTPNPVIATLDTIDASCNPGCDGKVIMTAQAGMSYTVTGFGTPIPAGDTIKNLCANNIYTVIGTNSTGCKDTIQVQVGTAGSTPIDTVSTTVSGCSPCSGIITMQNIVGMVYNLQGQSANTNVPNRVFVGLCAGSYTIEGKDINGCVSSKVVTIGVTPNPVIATLDTIDASCNPGCDGKVIMTAQAGMSYTVTGFGTPIPAGDTIKNLCANNIYTVIGTNSTGCKDTIQVQVGTAGSTPIDTVSTTVSGCSPCSGIITMQNIVGMVYNLQGQSANTNVPNRVFVGLCAGSYTIEGKDINGCVSSKVVTIGVTPNPVIATLDTIDASCNPGCDGKVIMTAQAGMSYTVTGFGTPIPAGDTIKNLCANNIYTVIGTNSTGCKDTIQVQVGTAGSTPIDTVSTTVSGCSPCSGIITMQNIVGMVYNLQGQSANTNVPNRVFVGLCAGSYTIEGKDINGCVSSKVVTIGVTPNPVIATLDTIDASCNPGCDGKVIMTAQAGMSYTVTGFGTPIPAGDTIKNLCANNIYTVIGTNSTGCKDTIQVQVGTAGSTPIDTVSTTVSGCSPCSGIITMQNIVGMVYNLQGQSANTNVPNRVFVGLCAGSYTIEGKDINGCVSSKVVTIGVTPNPVIATLDTIDASCNPGCDGKVIMTAQAGMSYTVTGFGTPIPAGDTIKNLCANNIYTVIGTNSTGCKDTIQVQVGTAGSTPIDTVSTTVSGCSPCSGIITMQNIVGMVYNLQGQSANTNVPNRVFVGLCAGSYTIEGKDINGCVSSKVVTIGVTPNPVIATLDTIDASCNPGCDGKVIMTAQAGMSYTVTGFGTPIPAGDTIKNLCANNIYTVIGTNSTGCKDTIQVQVGTAGSTPIDTVSTTVSGCSPCSGIITMQNIVGMVYNLQGQSANTNVPNRVFVGLCAGSYTIEGKDINGCVSSKVVTIGVTPNPVIATLDTIDASCNPGCDGKVIMTAQAGMSYTVTGFGTPIPAGDTIKNLCANNIYTVIGTNSTGCKDTIQVQVGTAGSTPIDTVSTTVSGCSPCSGIITMQNIVGMVYNLQGQSANTNVPNRVFVGLCAGSYTIEGKDINGCVSSKVVTIGVTPNPVIATLDTIDASCNPGCDGKVIMTAQAGMSYTVTGFGTPIPAGDTIKNLCANNIYTVIGTNSTGCKDTIQVQVGTAGSTPIDTVSTTVSGCSPCSGIITMQNIVGMVYNLQGQSANTNVPNRVFVGLCAGSYTIEGKDINGCVSSKVVTIGVTPNPVIATLDTIDASCNPGCDGKVIMTAQAGMSYTVTGFGTPIPAGDTIKNLCANNIYTVIGTNSTGCKDTIQVQVGTAGSTPIDTVSTTVSGCSPCSGIITMQNIVGMVYNLQGQSANTNVPNRVFVGLCAGSYTIEGKDINGCVSSKVVTIGVTPNPVIATLDTIDASCNPGCDGKVIMTAQAGMSYTVTGFGTPIPAGDTIKNLCANNIYTVIGTNSTGCKDTIQVQVGTAGSTPIDTVSTTVSGCSPCSGIITMQNIVGMVYNLQGQSANTNVPNRVFVGLCAGSYTIEGKDINGCVSSKVVTIGVTPNPVIATLDTIDASCNPGCDGKVIMTAQAGMSYTVTGFGTPIPAGDTIKNLCANNIYTVIGTNSTGCKDTIQVQVGTAGSTPIDTVSTTVSGCSPCSGIITMQNIVGMVYNLQGQSANTNVPNRVFVGLCAGSYTIEGKDINGCVSSKVVTIGVTPNPVIATLDTIDASCNPGCDGKVIMTAQAGMSYTVTGFGTPIPAGDTIKNLCANNIYTVIGTNSTGCKDTIQVQVGTAGSTPIDTVSTTVSGCSPCSGIITMQNIVGMVYNLQGQSANTNVPNRVFVGLCAGSYTIEGKDINGCVSSKVVTIGVTPSPTITTTSTNVTVYIPNQNGTITATGNGGTPPYTYAITTVNGGAFQVSDTFLNLDSSLVNNCYTVVVKDSKGCTGSTIQCVQATPQIGCVIAASSNVTCFGLNNGTLDADSIGGVPNYTYSISSGTINASNGKATGLAPGLYVVTVTDGNNFTATTSITINQGTSITMNAPIIGSPTCAPGCDGSIAITASSSTGSAISSYLLTSPIGSTCNPTQTSAGIFANIGTGTYIVKATDINGCTSSSNIFVATPATPVIDSIKKTNLDCNSFCNGKITVFATGSNYTYKNNSGAYRTSPIFDTLCAGTYTITVKSAFNCTATTTVIITEPSPLVKVSSSSTSPKCFNDNNGIIIFTASGGTNPIKYSIDGINFSPSGTFNTLPAGFYTITAKDTNNCAITDTFTLNNPLALAWNTTSSTNITCNGANNGKITVTTTGGTNPITLKINGVIGTSPFTGLAANTYTITALDANGCSITSSFTIVEPPLLTLGIPAIVNNVCFGQCNGSVTIVANGGTPGYTYNLNPGGFVNTTNGVFNNLCTLPLPQVYTITVIDASGCTATTTFSIAQPAEIVFTPIQVQNVACFGASTGSIKAIANGGTGTLGLTNYSISPTGNQFSPGFFTDLAAGTYNITVTDISGCSIATFVTITQNPPIYVSTFGFTEPICSGDPTGTISVTALGGVNPYLYSLDGGALQPSGQFNNLIAKNYLITIQDALGCSHDTNVVVTQPLPVGAKLTLVDANCVDSKDGKLFVQGTGGRGGYKYYITPGLNINKSGIFSGLEQGTYTLRVVDTAGCEYSEMFTINPPSNPLSNVITKQDLGCTGKGNEGQATANVSGGTPPYTYLWSTNPVQTTATAGELYFGNYFVQITDANGCQIKDTVYIEEGPCCDISFIPNAFSPNGDGKNDVFRVLTTAGIQLKQLDIFNRWGKRVWSTGDYRMGWDGTIDGEQAPMETYHYIFRYKCSRDEKDYTKKGDVILVR